jgi:peptidoglycan/xylan/chitin deacetylase (PgdA/CDA1 family)
VYVRRRLVAVGLLALVLFGAYTAVAALVRADPRAASAGQGDAAARARGADASVPTPVAATQAPGPVDCAVRPCIALTFDDGPVPQTADVLDLFAARGVRATFFVIGRQAKRYPSILARATEAGHEIGNHSWSHVNLRRADAGTAAKELVRTADAVKAATGTRPRTMRPPFGDATTSAAAKAGLPQVLWSLDTLDWKNRSTPAVVQRVLAEAQPGGIVLMHDVHATTRAALPQIVEGLLTRGYALVTVSELLGTDLTAGTVYRSGPAPTA